MIDFDLTHTLHTTEGPLRLQAQATLNEGDCIALFGASGAGKTTLLRMLAGLTRPEAGRIAVKGRTWFDAAAGIDLPPQQRSIGFVFQDHALFPNMTVRDNIAYAALKGDTAWVDELIALMDLNGLRQRLPERLSGGQKQRVALARALARKPDLLLLDEPLSALDHTLRRRLQDDLQRLQRRFHCTMLLVSHDIGEIFRLAQQVLHLEAGRIVQAGTPSAVFLQQRLAGRLQLQAQVLGVRREEVVQLVSLLVGQEVIDVIASDEEAASLRPGDMVALAAKALSPLLPGK